MKKINDYLVGIIFLMVGIIFLGIISFFYISDKKFIDNAIKTNGIIENISYDYIGVDDDIDVKVIVSYKDKFKNTYKGLSNYNSSKMKTGDKVVVYYDKDNPNNFRVEEDLWMNYLFFGMSGLFLVLGIVLIIHQVLKIKNGNKLMQTGIKLTATINSVTKNTRYQVNGESPSIINVSFIYQDLVYNAKSMNIWYNVEYIINTFNIKELPIYIEINNPKKYYLDTKELEKYFGK